MAVAVSHTAHCGQYREVNAWHPCLVNVKLAFRNRGQTLESIKKVSKPHKERERQDQYVEASLNAASVSTIRHLYLRLAVAMLATAY